MDKLLSSASAFDWITPTVAYIQDYLNAPVTDFGIPAASGWGRGDIKRLLKKHDIPVWGMMLNLHGDLLMFTVPEMHGQKTRTLLQQEGLLPLQPAVEAENPLSAPPLF